MKLIRSMALVVFIIPFMCSCTSTKPQYIYAKCPIELPPKPYLAIKSLQQESTPPETAKAYAQTVSELDNDDDMVRLKAEACQ